jgi:hypothetical protein
MVLGKSNISRLKIFLAAQCHTGTAPLNCLCQAKIKPRINEKG